MRVFDFRYAMRLEFDRPVTGHAFQLRCVPARRSGAVLLRKIVTSIPDVPLSEGTDGFGNTLHYGIVHRAHELFSIEVSGRIEISGAQLTGDRFSAAMYLPQTRFTRPGPALRALYDSVPAFACRARRAEEMMRTVHEKIAYIPAATDSTTTAESAAEGGCGVCQDQAQILLSLLRMDGIPCRYVSGMIPGEGQTHAWVEALIDGLWIGYDPTNGVIVGEEHIVIAVGRDHCDCELNRGVMSGFAAQTQMVSVSVEEVI